VGMKRIFLFQDTSALSYASRQLRQLLRIGSFLLGIF